MSHRIANESALSGLERRVADEIDDEEPWALLERFADLERVSGSDDEVAAAEYIIDRLEAFDIEYERYDPELYLSLPHDASVTAVDRDFEGSFVKTVSFSADRTVTGPVEYVGSAGPSFLDDPDPDEIPSEPYADVGDLAGKVALTAAGSLSIRATRMLEDKGAEAVVAIHQHEREPHNGIATPIWGAVPELGEQDLIPDIPIVHVTKPDGAQLREWAESDDGVTVEVSTDLTTGWFECPLVVAEIGPSDADTEEFVLLHGHYDSWHVGITDNATGDAGLLELARVLDGHADELQRNLRIAWWPGHSTGRYAGSTWYADAFGLDLARNCVAHVNMDSPGAKDATEYADMSCWTPEAHGLVTDAIDDVTGARSQERFPFRAGDYSFDNLGITGFFMLSSNIPADVRDERGYHTVGGCGGNSDAWHLTTDTLDTAGREELVRDIRVYAVSLLRVLTADVLPFDHGRNAAKIHSAVQRYDDAAGDRFDFSPTLETLTRLTTEIEAFETAVSSGDVDPTVANRTITELSRVLTRLNLVKAGQFEQDPAVSRQPVPRYAPAEQFDTGTLDSDERRFLARQLQREQNSVVYEIEQLLEKIPTA
ncbi:Peptidase family M28 [Halogranum gelatinilyticum]|uniref:Peptidase family M28 n=1 Tax=Halogranum gelatinilyticum TaxID=660521 RepID=A0A1G9Z0A4_9EURY|nr:M28 family peptidase [Halogranum gelatinilyticum]SDN14754.1 Peptidase family M28 [Halogranum gelatinilyticum]